MCAERAEPLHRWRGQLNRVEPVAPAEAFQGDAAALGEAPGRVGGELADDLRNQDLTGRGAGADARRQIDGGAIEVALLGERLAGVDADTHPDRQRRRLVAAGDERVLDRA